MRCDTDGLETAERLLASLNHEFVISSERVRVGASIGVSRFPGNGDTASMLLQSADYAMYQAKRGGKECVFTFNASLADESRERSKLEQQLRDAIVRQEFRLVYQPQVRCSDNKVIGLQALIRWARLERLRKAGVRIAIDDFGTGYSSLSYLQELPLDDLKIDRTFVNRLCDNSDQTSLVNTILLMAGGLGLETVAEGVELPDQRDEIMRLGCDLRQGFLYSRPVSATDIPATIDRIQSQSRANLVLQRVK